MQFTEVKIEVFIPEEYIEMLRNELNKIGACKRENMIIVCPIVL